MFVYGTSSSPLVTGIGVGTGTDAYSDLITGYINTIAGGSAASLDDKLNAWANLGSLVVTASSSTNPQPLLYLTNKGDCQRATDAYYNSSFAKQIQQVSGQYCASMYPPAGGGESNFAQSTLDALNKFSSADQKIIFYGQGMEIKGMRYERGGWNYYDSLDDWKTSLTQQSAAYVAQQASASTAAAAAAATAVTHAVTTAIATITAKAASSTADIAGKSALTTLTQHGGSASAGSIALQVLLNSQEQKTAHPGAIGRTAKTGTGGASSDSAASSAKSPGPASANAAHSSALNRVA